MNENLHHILIIRCLKKYANFMIILKQFRFTGDKIFNKIVNIYTCTQKSNNVSPDWKYFRLFKLFKL